MRQGGPSSSADATGNMLKPVFKYGSRTGVTTTQVDAWIGSEGNYPFLTTAATMYVSNADATDTYDVAIEGVDANGDYQVGVATLLAGRTQVEIKSRAGVAQTYLHVDRAQITSLDTDRASNAGVIYVATAGALTAGVPYGATTVKAQIAVGHGQSEQAILFIPRNHHLTLDYVEAAVIRANGAATGVTVELWYRKTTGAWLSKGASGGHNQGEPAILHFPHRYKLHGPAYVRVGVEATSSSQVFAQIVGEISDQGN